MNRAPVPLAALLLLFMSVLAGGSMRRESITFDEVGHIGAGVSYLQKFDLRMNPEHPPLAKLLSALPVVLRRVRADYSDPSWSVSNHGFGNMLGEWPWGHSIVFAWNDSSSTIFWSRVPMLLLTLLLGIVLYRYAAQLGGPWGGILCLAVYVSTPAFLVFGPLVLTDIPVTLTVLLALWSFAELWRAPSRTAMLSFGALLGVSFLTKFSAGILLFAFLAFRISLRWLPIPGMPTDPVELKSWRRLRGRYFWKGILIASITVYAVYFIFSWNQPSDLLSSLGHTSASLVLRRLLMPPVLYLRGFVFFLLGSTRSTFLFGRFYTHGQWFYFPIIFLLKSTLAFLFMLVAATPLAMLARKKLGRGSIVPPEEQFHWRTIWISLLVFVAFCMISRMTISIRHFTIPIALMILLLAPLPLALHRLANNGWAPARLATFAFAALALLSLATMARTYPYFFPFVNSLSFGHPTYWLFSDSNLDWNQALPDVEQFVQQRGISHVLLDEYGINEPTVYVPQAQFWNCQEASPADAGQWAVVSAAMLLDSHNCAWLLHYPHESIAAGSMYAFQLPAVIPPVGDPAGPPPPSEFHYMGAPSPIGTDSRLIFRKCLQDPTQLQPTLDQFQALFEAEMAKRRAARQKH